MSQAGALLLTQRSLVAERLDRGLSAGLARWRAGRAVHDPGKIIADLAVTLALGGDFLADVDGAAGKSLACSGRWPLTR